MPAEFGGRPIQQADEADVFVRIKEPDGKIRGGGPCGGDQGDRAVGIVMRDEGIDSDLEQDKGYDAADENEDRQRNAAAEPFPPLAGGRGPRRAGLLGLIRGAGRLEAAFRTEAVPAFDLFDGVFGARQADIIVFTIDLYGPDLVPVGQQALDFLQGFGQLFGRACPRRGGRDQPAGLQGVDGIFGFRYINSISLLVMLDRVDQVPAPGHLADLLQGRGGRGGLAWQDARQ